MTELQAKIVLVTGASSGIGEASARALARAGAKLILVARRKDRLEGLANDLKNEYQTDSLPIPLDLRDQRETRKRLGELPEEWRDIDILVNNAGLVRGLKKLYDMIPEEWENVFEVNVLGLINVTNTIVPRMLERGVGHIINIGSIAGREVYPNGAVYCASKFAVRALSRGLKMDLQGTPIRVTSIDPGLVETEFSVIRFDGDTDRAKEPYKGITPLHGEDIAEAVVWSATRPAHVNIQEMLIFPTAQAGSTFVSRSEQK